MSKVTSIFHVRKDVMLIMCLLVPGLTLPAMAQSQTQTQGVSAQAPTANSRPTPAVSTYRINPGDQVEIYVWGEERLQRKLTVLPDGTIAFPLVGQIRVAGLMPQEVERLVSDRLKDQYRGDVPFVTASITAPAGMQFSVLGKVKGPGVFNVGRYVNVLEALGQAGGPDEFASLDNVTVIRGSGATAEALRVRLGSLFRSGVATRDVQAANLLRIEPGDVIVVP